MGTTVYPVFIQYSPSKVFAGRYCLNICRRWINVWKQPMVSTKQSSFRLLRVLLAAGWSLLCILIIGAPILASRAYYVPASFIYLLFSSVCHQMPDRSFIFSGFPFAVCHRCSGIYLGLILGTLFKNPFLDYSPGIRRAWVLASTVPLLIDVMLPVAGKPIIEHLLIRPARIHDIQIECAFTH